MITLYLDRAYIIAILLVSSPQEKEKEKEKIKIRMKSCGHVDNPTECSRPEAHPNLQRSGCYRCGTVVQALGANIAALFAAPVMATTSSGLSAPERHVCPQRVMSTAHSLHALTPLGERLPLSMLAARQTY
jgi:hypothetical protein